MQIFLLVNQASARVTRFASDSNQIVESKLHADQGVRSAAVCVMSSQSCKSLLGNAGVWRTHWTRTRLPASSKSLRFMNQIPINSCLMILQSASSPYQRLKAAKTLSRYACGGHWISFSPDIQPLALEFMKDVGVVTVFEGQALVRAFVATVIGKFLASSPLQNSTTQRTW